MKLPEGSCSVSQYRKSYTGLSSDELLALSQCGGEAVRLYIALALHCYGRKTKGFASKKKLLHTMGKEKRLGGKGWKSNMNKLFRELESAGLFHWGNKRRVWTKDNQWGLPMKAKVIHRQELKKQKEQKQSQVKNDSPSQDSYSESQVENGAKSSTVDSFQSQVEKDTHNIKDINEIDINIRNKNKINNNQFIDKENSWLTQYDPDEIYSKAGNKHSRKGILQRLENNEIPIFLSNYSDEELEDIANNLQLKRSNPEGMRILKKWCFDTGVFMRLLER